MRSMDFQLCFGQLFSEIFHLIKICLPFMWKIEMFRLKTKLPMKRVKHMVLVYVQIVKIAYNYSLAPLNHVGEPTFNAFAVVIWRDALNASKFHYFNTYAYILFTSSQGSAQLVTVVFPDVLIARYLRISPATCHQQPPALSSEIWGPRVSR